MKGAFDMLNIGKFSTNNYINSVGFDWEVVDNDIYKIEFNNDLNRDEYYLKEDYKNVDKGIRFNKDGSIDKRHCNKVAGVSSEVYGFNTDEIGRMIKFFNESIENAPDENKKQIAQRNKLIFIIGLNVGLRASDLTKVRWNFFFDEDGNFRDFYMLQPQKTKKTRKFVKIFFNQTVKKVIEEYISYYPIEDMNDYLFKSRKGNNPISERSLWRIIVDASKEVGIKHNVGTHSLRKSWAFHIWHDAEDKNKALVMLQQCMNHSSTVTTLKYIGVLDTEKKDMYESIELGMEFL